MSAQENLQSSLLVYSAACVAVANAKSVDEVLEIRARAEAVRAYAYQSKNRQLEIEAAEIRLRALRRLGQLLTGIRHDGRLEPTNDPKDISDRQFKRLIAKEFDINEGLASKAFKAASYTDIEYESLVGKWRDLCLNEKKVFLSLEPRKLRANHFNPAPAPTPEGPLDNFYLPGLENQWPIGDLPIHMFEDFIADCETTIDELVWSIAFLKRLQEHFGGGFPARPDADQIALRDVMGNAKLQSIIDEIKAHGDE